MKLIIAAFFLLNVLSVEWENTEVTTNLWRMVNSKENYQLATFLVQDPTAKLTRSEDGRGVLWWAWEYGNAEALATLQANGLDMVSEEEDEQGNKPQDMAEDFETLLAQAQALVPEAQSKKEKIEEYIKKTYEANQAAQEEEDDDDDDDDEAYYDDEEDEVEEEIEEEDLTFDWDDEGDDSTGDEFHDEL